MNLSKIHHIAIIVSDYEAAKDQKLTYSSWGRYWNSMDMRFSISVWSTKAAA